MLLSYYLQRFLRSHNMRYYILAVLFFLATSIDAINPADAEKSIAMLHKQLAGSSSDERSDSISNAMRTLFLELFEQQEPSDFPSAFDYPFDQLQFCKVKSSDNRLRLFNWNQPRLNGTHKYYCFVLVKNPKQLGFTWYELKDNENEPDKIENKFLNADKWMGALYYEIIPMDKKGRGDTYTLLGWDGKDNLTTRKIIDAITIMGSKVRLGAGLYRLDDGTRKRMIFEYSEEVSMSVKFYPKKKCIVLDHLSPKNPLMTGIYADYGPDGSYDILMMKKGKWELIENADISEFVNGDDKPFRDPRKK